MIHNGKELVLDSASWSDICISLEKNREIWFQIGHLSFLLFYAVREKIYFLNQTTKNRIFWVLSILTIKRRGSKKLILAQFYEISEFICQNFYIFNKYNDCSPMQMILHHRDHSVLDVLLLGAQLHGHVLLKLGGQPGGKKDQICDTS